MAQVIGHIVLSNGDHELEFDDSTKKVYSGKGLPAGVSWGDVLRANGLHEATGDRTPPKEKK